MTLCGFFRYGGGSLRPGRLRARALPFCRVLAAGVCALDVRYDLPEFRN